MPGLLLSGVRPHMLLHWCFELLFKEFRLCLCTKHVWTDGQCGWVGDCTRTCYTDDDGLSIVSLLK